MIIKSKSGDVHISLSWVFMIIVGAFFIVLSYSIVSKYQENEERKHELELSLAMREILNKVGHTSGIEKAKIENTPDVFEELELEVVCIGGEPLLSINGNINPNNQFLENYPTFMSKINKGSINTYIIVENYKLPFKITNLLAIVSTKNIIVLDENSDIFEELLLKFNREYRGNIKPIKKDFSGGSISPSEIWNDIKDKNPSNMIFVTDDNGNIPTEESSDLPFYSVLIERDPNNPIGNITYHNKSGEPLDSFTYIDYDESLSLISMAIFSTPHVFNCSYNLLMRHIEPVYNFYISKSNYMRNKSYYNKEICSLSLDEQGRQIGYLLMNESLVSVRDELATNNFKNIQDSALYNKVLNVSKQARKLDSNSCLLVY